MRTYTKEYILSVIPKVAQYIELFRPFAPYSPEAAEGLRVANSEMDFWQEQLNGEKLDQACNMGTVWQNAPPG